MRIRFRPLASLVATHAYVGGAPCPGAHFVVPPDTARTLAGARVLARERTGVLHLLYEADEADQPLARLDGRTLRFGLQLHDPVLWNVTAPAAGFPRRAMAWDNAADRGVLAAGPGVVVSTARLTHAVASAARPLTVTPRTPGGIVLAGPVTIPAGDSGNAATFDLRGLPPGRVTVVEQHAGAERATSYLVDDALGADRVAGIVEVTVDAAHYDAPPAFTLVLAARAEPLGYYVVARRWNDAEFAQLAVTDAGAAEDGRAPIAFTRIAAEAFGPDELPVPLLTAGAADARVALFRSTTPLPRQAAPRRRLQLVRNGDILVPDLPQPGPDRSQAGMIVHVTRP